MRLFSKYKHKTTGMLLPSVAIFFIGITAVSAWGFFMCLIYKGIKWCLIGG